MSIDRQYGLSVDVDVDIVMKFKNTQNDFNIKSIQQNQNEERKKNNFCGFYVICCLRIFITKNWKGITLWLLREKLFFDIVKMSQ